MGALRPIHAEEGELDKLGITTNPVGCARPPAITIGRVPLELFTAPPVIARQWDLPPPGPASTIPAPLAFDATEQEGLVFRRMRKLDRGIRVNSGRSAPE